MQTYSYYSRNLLIEFLQKTIYFNFWKSLNNNFYWYFTLINKNRILIQYNKNKNKLYSYLKYEDKNKKNKLIYSTYFKNDHSITTFVNKIDDFLEKNNLLKNNFRILDEDNFNFSLNL